MDLKESQVSWLARQIYDHLSVYSKAQIYTKLREQTLDKDDLPRYIDLRKLWYERDQASLVRELNLTIHDNEHYE